MGADATWVCHTCGTVCPRGGTPPFVRNPEALTLQDIIKMKENFAEFRRTFETEDGERTASFLNDLHNWLGRHFGHDFHIGTDYTTDAMELDGYFDESVDGVISHYTRLELQPVPADDVPVTREAIGAILAKHLKYADAIEELYNLFTEGGV